MRGIFAAVLMGSLGISAGQAAAGGTQQEAEGNWAGAQGGGFFFRATLQQEADAARLRIWNALDDVPQGGEPQLDVAEFALSAFATDQRLEVEETASGSVLRVVTEFADEEGEGREVVTIQYLDNQFTVIGYFYRATMLMADETSCEVDVWNGKAIENGVQRVLPPMDFEAMNAGIWHYGAAIDYGWCQLLDG